jgi:hypothetical protein
MRIQRRSRTVEVGKKPKKFKSAGAGIERCGESFFNGRAVAPLSAFVPAKARSVAEQKTALDPRRFEL